MSIPNRPQAFRGGLPVARPVAAPVALPVGAPLPPGPFAPQPGISGADDPSAAFSNRYAAQDLGAPVGSWSRVRSTWLYAMRYDPYPQVDNRPNPYGDLQLEMNDGAVLLWQNVTRADYLAFWRAPSKGKFLYHSWARKSDYQTIRGTQYTGAALAQRVHANS